MADGLVHTMQIHGDYVVCARAREEVCDQCARLRHPLPVSGLGLEHRGLGRVLPGDSMEAVDAVDAVDAICSVDGCRLLRLVRSDGIDRVAAAEAVRLAGAGWRVRVAGVALVHLHATELVVEGGRAIGQAGALGLSGVRRLRARIEGVGAGARARARILGQRGARLVVGNVRLARVGEERQNGGDALRRGGAAGGDGDEESIRQSGTSGKSAMPRGVLHQMVVDCGQHRLAQALQEAHAQHTRRAPGGGAVPFPPPDWMMKTSFPRTLSSISTRVSPTLNLPRRTFAGAMPRWLQMVLYHSKRRVLSVPSVAAYSVSCGCELPPRTTRLRTMTPVAGFLFTLRAEEVGGRASAQRQTEEMRDRVAVGGAGEQILRNWVAW